MDGSNPPFVPANEDSDDEFDDEIFLIVAAIDSDLAMYNEIREMVKARRESLQRQSQQNLSLTQHFSTGNSTPLINRAIALLDELQDEITDEIYMAASIALTDEQLQNAFVFWNKQRRLLWLSKLKPLD
jgi:methylase of polypeptide subunit release factors